MPSDRASATATMRTRTASTPKYSPRTATDPAEDPVPAAAKEPLGGGPHDPDARPPLDEVLAVREDRMATVARVLDELTHERLEELTEPVLEPGYPESKPYPVRRCLGTVIHEEWLHREYAERDLAVLQGDRHDSTRQQPPSSVRPSKGGPVADPRSTGASGR
jgi:hypothetical protein